MVPAKSKKGRWKKQNFLKRKIFLENDGKESYRKKKNDITVATERGRAKDNFIVENTPLEHNGTKHYDEMAILFFRGQVEKNLM
jgi:hypothetical protein